VLRSRVGLTTGLAWLLIAVPSASAGGGLSLSISTPRIEGAPIMFTASGVAAGAFSDGESTDFLQGAVIHQDKPCPGGGADTFGDIPGTVVTTVDVFPIGPFDVRSRVVPTGVDAQTLLAGNWRECVYLQDRDTNAVTDSAQEDFIVRRAHVSAHVLSVPRHLHFYHDTLGRPNAMATFVVRARAEVALRTVEILVEGPGQHRPCVDDMNPHRGGASNPLRVTTGPARTYRLRTEFLFNAGRPPYGQRLRVCAIVAYRDPNEETLTPEGAAQTSFVVRR
jgi:hypothetical protein